MCKRLFILLALLSLAPQVSADDLLFKAGIRERSSYLSAADFDKDASDTGWFWTQRLTASIDYRLSKHVSAHITLLSALQDGLSRSPVQQNDLDYHQAYFDFGVGWNFRIGRQELVLGSQRLFGSREGTNVRRNWDGARLTVPAGQWNTDLFAMQLVRTKPSGAFNDTSSSDRNVFGAYATHQSGWDFYYFFTRQDEARRISKVGNEKRQTLGARYFGTKNSWFWNWEVAIQGGQVGEQDIQAWTVASNTGYKLNGKMKPELMLSVNVASGDDEISDGTLKTFNALFPKGNYFSEIALLGPSNFINFNPNISLQPSPTVKLNAGINWYWRLETADGLYGPPGNIIRSASGSSSRFVNTAVSAGLDWQITEHVEFSGRASYSKPESLIEDTGAADTIQSLELTIYARF